MELSSIPAISAVWLGILTSVSPCPLASNIAAVSYIVKGGERTAAVVLSGLAYTLGRAAAYTVLGSLISASLLNVPAVSHFLQTSMPKVLGPVLILTGLFLLEVITVSLPGLSISQQTSEKLKKEGVLGALALGFLFALAFCPLSAALFFGSLIPLSIKQASPVALPLLYGIGTGLPVFGFALLILLGVKNIGRLFHAVTKAEYWLRRITALVLMLVGIYYTCVYIFNIQVFS